MNLLKPFIFLLMALALSALFPCYAVPNNTQAVQLSQKPLKATVTEYQYLPAAMYGEWSIRATLIDTNLPDFFPKTIQDIWILERTGNQVSVSNPVTGASAWIQVDKVEDDTATFHRQITVEERGIFTETPTVHVDRDRLTGVVVNTYQTLKGKTISASYFAKYQLAADRIAGARVQFGKEPPKAEDLEFEIEEVRPEIPRSTSH